MCARGVMDLAEPGGITAVLGPTNTGKTHLAIERLLAHRTGMIGLPLRLLAREVYDRLVAVRGESAVALVTGEEKRIPAQPRYWVCTVEAMPVDRPVSALVVDEIQICADPGRGHVFTDRLLRARGVHETLFLGSDAMEGVLTHLLPTARVLRQQRLSTLRWSPPRKLAGLPPRSAVVAFSAERVYEVADRLKRRRGGAAVVLGALSPRTRNAQVALYQSGEVDFLVATDAIGMGLNLDVEHVAFADTRKFDGRSPRGLTIAEVAQIAGRAGRYKRDGTFGTLADIDSLDPSIIAAVQAHEMPRIEALWWRNGDLDTSSLRALLASLAVPPPVRCLLSARQVEDQAHLAALVARPEIVARANTPDAVARLWEIAQVPDYEKTLTDSHVHFLAWVWSQLTGPTERLSADAVSAQLDRLDRSEGDIETLMARIAHVRTWTYVAFRGDWLDDARAWQERTRAIEDRLSDALHEQLTARFVDTSASITVPRRGVVPVEVDGKLRLGDIALGSWAGLRWRWDGLRVEDRVARRLLQDSLTKRIAELEAAGDAEIGIEPSGAVTWRGDVVARLTGALHWHAPGLRIVAETWVAPEERAIIEKRLLRVVEARVDALRAPCSSDALRELSPNARGLVHVLDTALGTIRRERVEDLLELLVPEDRKGLARLGIRVGTEVVYVLPWLAPEPTRLRSALAAAFLGHDGPVPWLGAATVLVAGDVPDLLYVAAGYELFDRYAVRVDVLEQVAAVARRAQRDGVPIPASIGRMLGAGDAVAEAVVRGLAAKRSRGRRAGRE